MDRPYPQYPSNDPVYGPGKPTDRWYPNLDAAPSLPCEPRPADCVYVEEEPAGPEPPADVCVALLRAFVVDIRQHVAQLPPRQPYTRLNV